MNIQTKLMSMIALVLICILSVIVITTNVNRDIAYLIEKKNDALEFRNTWLTFTGVNKSLLITDISDPAYLILLRKHKSLLAEITETISNINSNIYLIEVDKELAEAYRNSSFIWDLSRDDFNQAQILFNSDLLKGINQKARYGSLIEIKERFKSKGSTREFLELDELMNRILSLSSANDSFSNSLDKLISVINKKITEQESVSQKVYIFASIFLVLIVAIALLLFGNQIVKNLKIVIERNKEIEERIKVEDELRISATAFESQESLIITDANSVILRVNNAFTDETGYASNEIVGQTPRLFRSGHHDEAFYKEMWDAINRTGKWQGEIWERRKNGEVYPKWMTISAVKGTDGVVTHYVGSHTDITERKAAETKIQHLAFYDPLTQLPNRRLLMDRLQQALASSVRRNRKGALLFLDLDNFKTLNDTLGHDVGDLLLQQVALRLQSCVREGDTVARLGGDEFVVLLEDLSEQIAEAAEQTEAIGEKILSALNLPYKLSSHECYSTTSIGATLFNGHQQAMDELIKQADIAMYQAKKSGRNTLCFFDPKMQEAVNIRAAIEGELRNALEKQQFHLYYQIQVDSNHRPLGAEVLIRWIHPERGLVSPLQFIPFAEESGFILPIGLWVLNTACAKIKAWEQDAHTCDLVLAVNVSARQFTHIDFVAQVQEIVRRHDIHPSRLKLEITESMLVTNIEGVISTMNTLNEMGIQFSLDDFGTGYSSLQYLKRLPLNQIKIDQSFVRDMTVDASDRSIVQTIIAMAKSLNLAIIAEGVETEEQRKLLASYGCHHYQGYLFSKPVPIAQFEALLKQG